jgi:hypothetical protein
VQSAGDPKQNGAVPIHIPGSANASLLSKIAVTAKTILNRLIDAPYLRPIIAIKISGASGSVTIFIHSA